MLRTTKHIFQVYEKYISTLKVDILCLGARGNARWTPCWKKNTSIDPSEGMAYAGHWWQGILIPILIPKIHLCEKICKICFWDYPGGHETSRNTYVRQKQQHYLYISQTLGANQDDLWGKRGILIYAKFMCWAVSFSIGRHNAKRSLIAWVIVIPKEGWTGNSGH